VGIAIIIIGALILIGIIYMMFFYKIGSPLVSDQPQVSTGESESAKIKPNEIDARTVTEVPEKKVVKKNDEIELTQIAYSFAERFGSYSNQSTYQNMLDLKVVMTPKMAKWVDGYVNEQITSKKDTSVYSGFTTKTVSVKLVGYSETATNVTAEVSTQRRESTGDNNNSASYGQVLNINFVKDGKDWKADEARWQDQKLK